MSIDGIQLKATNTFCRTLLWDSKIHKQRLPAGPMSSWDYQFHSLEPSKVSHRQFPCDPGRRLQATQLAEIKLPCLDVVHGSGWLPGTQADDAP